MSGDGPRIAVVGAATAHGEWLRAALAESRVPGGRVDLYGTATGEAVLADYAGEARLIQEPDLETLVVHDVIYLCETGGIATTSASAAGAGALVVDVAGALGDRDDVPVVHPDVNPGVAREGGRVAAPDVITALLVEVLRPLETDFGIEDATATVVRPAADFGDAGVEELRQQTVRLLNFMDVPTEVFGRQLAFNLIAPSRSVDGADAAIRARRELRRLLGWDRERLALAAVVAPLFHGHAMNVRVRTTRPSTPDAIREALTALAPGDAGAATPLDVTGDARSVVVEVAPDGLGGSWVWAVAGEGPARAARLAARLADLAPRPRRSTAS